MNDPGGLGLCKGLKAGIIGLGRIASLYEEDSRASAYYPYLTHAGSYSKHPSVELVCGADINNERLQQFGERWGVTRLYHDYLEMLSENKLDILSICTHPDLHYEIVRSARTFVKVIFCEKPFTKGLKEIQDIAGWSEKDDAKITVNLYREYDKSHLKVRELLTNGSYGAIQRINCFIGKGLRNMGTHLIGYLMNTLGIPEKISVINKSFCPEGDEYSYDVYMEFKERIPVFIQSCNFDNFRLFEMDFICKKGRIQILDEGLTIKVYEVFDNRAESGARELREQRRVIRTTVGYALYHAVDHLVRLIRDPRLKPAVPPKNYLEIQRVIEEIERQGGQVHCMRN
jgi:predicted dehydrogenase